MKYTNTVFNQLLQFIPRYRFQRVVDRYKGDHRTRHFSCWDQFVCMLFSQFTHRQSLRDLEQGFNSQSNRHYHLGVRTIRKSTLADANQNRPANIYLEIFYDLLGQLRKHHGFQSKEMIRLVDSTTIDLNLNHFAWAKFRQTKAGIKLHTVYDPNLAAPVFFAMTEAKMNDFKAVSELPFLSNATYVFDRAYCKYQWLYQLHQNKTLFVTRLKSGAQYEVIKTHSVDKESNVLSDQTIRLSSDKGQDYPKTLRLVTFKDTDQNRTFQFLCNDNDRSAEAIADLYKQRWQIELFFKWIKQNLKIKRFLGHSENAVRIQILIAMIAYLLTKLIQLKHQLHRSLQLCIRWIAINIMQTKEIETMNQAPPDRKSKTQESPQLVFDV